MRDDAATGTGGAGMADIRTRCGSDDAVKLPPLPPPHEKTKLASFAMSSVLKNIPSTNNDINSDD